MTTLLPINYDPASKQVSIVDDSLTIESLKDLKIEINQLNSLYSDFLKSNSEIPPPPKPELFTKNLSMMIKKMHESAVLLSRQGNFDEALKKFDIALGLASARSKLESFQLTLPEIIICLMGRCDCYTNLKQFGKALQDAEVLVLLGANVPDNHLRRGICNLNLCEFLTAKSDFERGLAFNPKHPILLKLLSIAQTLIDESNGDA